MMFSAQRLKNKIYMTTGKGIIKSMFGEVDVKAIFVMTKHKVQM